MCIAHTQKDTNETARKGRDGNDENHLKINLNERRERENDSRRNSDE